MLAGWVCWVASFRGPASIGCPEMLAGFFLGWAHKPASIFLQNVLAKFEIMLESDENNKQKNNIPANNEGERNATEQ